MQYTHNLTRLSENKNPPPRKYTEKFTENYGTNF